MHGTPYAQFLEHRVNALDKIKAYKDLYFSTWLRPKKDLWKRFVGFAKNDIYCHIHIFRHLPNWVQLLKLKLAVLVEQFQKDEEILKVIPWPSEAGYHTTDDTGGIGWQWANVDSKLVAAM